MTEVNYDAGVVLEALNDKVDRDFGNVPSNFVNFAKYSKNVTNCITEIPQDIKLELNDGVLTLKAGSKLYKGDGSHIILDNDLVVSPHSGSGTFVVFCNIRDNKAWANQSPSACTSGTTPPTGSGMFYNTSTMTVAFYRNGVLESDVWSLSLAIVTVSDGTITSIDQVFNGFSYIGSTVFALPGVKGLIPDGRNADGSLRSIEFVTSKVVTHTWGSETYGTFDLALKNDNTVVWYSNLLVKSDNYLYNGNTYLGADKLVIGRFNIKSSSDNGKIASFSTKLPFRVVDYNDALNMPDYTAGILVLNRVQGTYTCLTKGWILYQSGGTGGTGSSFYINDIQLSFSTATYWNGSCCVPVEAGDVVELRDNNYGQLTFYPCKGVN